MDCSGWAGAEAGSASEAVGIWDDGFFDVLRALLLVGIRGSDVKCYACHRKWTRLFAGSAPDACIVVDAANCGFELSAPYSVFE